MQKGINFNGQMIAPISLLKKPYTFVLMRQGVQNGGGILSHFMLSSGILTMFISTQARDYAAAIFDDKMYEAGQDARHRRAQSDYDQFSAEPTPRRRYWR
ncbi:hypothetical protein [Sulfitobacter sp. EhC04]|uniref:hypothetical protein n=1 Tax=Sulfitobacter sp. EhC04 TaxID=1849168 RepID=UPI00082EB9FC|nr:hypothetical protein [Sulfitobacter sp. EhC04]